ncbi:SEC10/PgrA surface exclusion domain-containing protein [Streptococcus suis]|uniref:SEC10/PgrA surface exclusion domain-containing protein n=6 Tax=Streptococcus suis TaxID=1307 RepID=UPI00211BF71E|nr:SEC10/PgrA surface exclusion domain-containing protein [Streptococcus suis]MDY7599472.1 SEC10/PgrA surface exclusion domain-containing protein [Streptococcus suis]MEE3745892.1 SEC10/PgrA surface exclusion domain-containing protein [Streptococcus suis]UUM49561.1 SEC10/PgrA surface exclusion domain-containing protein [Streptococcus suis]HEL1657010.1 SEC10/PgrA surface exclusion domain-containing protein [Streptococcus suis]HEL1673395.1 SEC10/PgrA surface exclusion domain-containing protein [S
MKKNKYIYGTIAATTAITLATVGASTVSADTQYDIFLNRVTGEWQTVNHATGEIVKSEPNGTYSSYEEAQASLATSTVEAPVTTETPAAETTAVEAPKTSADVKPALDAQQAVVDATAQDATNAQADADTANQDVTTAQADVDTATQAVKDAEANTVNATPENIAANQADQAANLADQAANATETDEVNAEITAQTQTVADAQTAVDTAQAEKDTADANVTAKEADVKAAQNAISGTGLAEAQANLDNASEAVTDANANVDTATQAVEDAKKADADRGAKIKAAETEVAVKSDAVDTAKAKLTAAQDESKTRTDALNKTNDAVKTATDALANVDTVTIADGKQFIEDRKTGDSDFMTDSGSTIIEQSSTNIGDDDKLKVIDVNTLSDSDKQELALYTLKVINAVRASQGLTPMQLTTGGMTAAKNQADKYITRDQLIQTAGHISGDYFGENVSNISKASATMYDIKLDIYNAIMTMAFNDAPSKWSHTNNMMSSASDLGVAFATFGGRTHIINVHGVYSGTVITDPNDPTTLQAALAKAQADQSAAQAASDTAQANLVKASSDYAKALELKTQAETTLADATATPLQTQVAENNLRLATIALQNAEARKADAQKAVDNFSADLATKKAALDTAKTELAQAQATATAKAEALETAKVELAKQQGTLDSLNKDKDALLAEKDRLVEEAKALATELKGYLDAPAILANAQATLTEKQAALTEAQAKAETAQNKLETVTAKLAAEESKLAKLQAEYNKLKDLEDKAKDNVIATLPDGTIVAVPKDAPTAAEKPAINIDAVKDAITKGQDVTVVDGKVVVTNPQAGVTVTPQGITYSRVDRAKTLPNTGEQTSLLALAGLTVLSSLGLVSARRRKQG